MGYFRQEAVLLVAALFALEATNSSPLHIGVAVSSAAPQPSDGHKDNKLSMSMLGENQMQDGMLDLEFVPESAEEVITPLNIVVDDDFSEWRQLQTEKEKTKQSAEKEETTDVDYGLDILNDKLPEQLVDCYSNMTKEHLEADVHNPAAYGDRLCGNLIEAKSCAGNKSRNTGGAALLEFKQEVEYVRTAICDPECPFAQVESCKSTIVNSANASSTCSISGTLSCADSMLAELKCRPEATAVVYWERTKMLAKLTHCHLQTEDCTSDVHTCLSPFSDYLKNQDVQKLCSEEHRITYCITSITSCAANPLANLLESSNHLLTKICHSEKTTPKITTPQASTLDKELK